MARQKNDYEGFCTDVMNSHEKIRFAAVLNRNGKILGGGHRENILRFLSPDETKQSMHNAIIRWKNRDKLSHKIGHGVFSITQYEKLIQITVPIGKNHLLALSTEIDVNYNKLLEKISPLIDQYFRGFFLKQYVSKKKIKEINQKAIIATKQDRGHVKQFSEIH